MDRSLNGEGAGAPARVLMTIGLDTFVCDLEWERAPRACEALMRLLPLRGMLGHGRWSGEAGWTPIGPGPFEVPDENLKGQPEPGQILFYGGGLSEAEILVPYGPTRFASVHGALSGSHVMTVRGCTARLRAVGEALLRQGAQAFQLVADPAGQADSVPQPRKEARFQ